MTVTTEEFRISAGRHVRVAMMSRPSTWLWVLVLPVLAAGVWIATGNMAWIITALILLMVAFPMVMLLVWTRYAFRIDAIRAIAPHVVEITDTEIRLTFSPAAEDARPLPEAVYKISDVTALQSEGSHLQVWVKASDGNSVNHLLLIPRSVLSDADAAAALLSRHLPTPAFD